MNIRTTLRASILVPALGAALSAQADSILRDDFEIPQSAVVSAATSGMSLGAGYALNPNTTRTLGLTIADNTAPGSAEAKTSINGGVFSGDNDGEVRAASFVRYDFANPIHFDFNDSLVFDFLTNDVPDILTVTGRGAGNYTTSFELDLPVSRTPFSVSKYLAGFGYYQDLTSVELTVGNYQNRTARDFQMTNFYTVPEPASMAALGLGALGLLRRRKVQC